MLVVNCPKCMTMLEDAVKTAGFEGKFQVKELIELVAEAMDLDGKKAAAQEAELV
jgi:Fe-S oxidoreductase